MHGGLTCIEFPPIILIFNGRGPQNCVPGEKWFRRQAMSSLSSGRLRLKKPRRLSKAKQSQAPHIVTGRSRQAPISQSGPSRLNATPSNGLVPRLRTLRLKKSSWFQCSDHRGKGNLGRVSSLTVPKHRRRSRNRTTPVGIGTCQCSPNFEMGARSRRRRDCNPTDLAKN